MSNKHEHSKTMSREMRQIIDHTQALLDATSGELDDRIKSARSALKDRLESVKNDYGEFEDQLMDKARAADKFFHAKPYYAIGGTLIAGLFLGWFFSRK
jgi:ElaB/YqjD/DUF883 family membrane-anchored ribosome-binding protein